MGSASFWRRVGEHDQGVAGVSEEPSGACRAAQRKGPVGGRAFHGAGIEVEGGIRPAATALL